MKDIVVGCISNYLPVHIAPWVDSLNKSGFKGDKVIISFGVPDVTVEYLNRNGFEVYAIAPNGRHIVIERFYALWEFLNEVADNYRYIITTDVKDVIFQTNVLGTKMKIGGTKIYSSLIRNSIVVIKKT